jgi:hypothetical protein
MPGLSGYVNKHNCRYWPPNHTHELHQRFLHGAKVTVWCAISSHGIYWSLFLRKCGVTCSNPLCVVVKSYAENIHPHQLDLLWFQQDGATTHTAQISTPVVRTLFPCKIIFHFGHITWPCRSPDLAVSDCLLWGYVKSTIYETRPANIDDLRRQLRQGVQGIT